ncbi:GntR family transcriptional regulator [Dactylosporangium sp. CA-092794]|uniref:GntR family transcriptional regulator n=1 Tax=Dactylosporangium sp. CA-092794 TaxID=3239929 RepID=UPI003D9325B5
MQAKKYSGVTKYRQIAEDIAARIASGEFPAGADLPSEGYLAKEYGTGRDAVRDALAELRLTGIVHSERGRRTHVRVAKPQVEIAVAGPVRISARMPTFPEREEYDVPDSVPMLVLETGEETVIVPADDFVVRPQPSGTATKPKITVPERQPPAPARRQCGCGSPGDRKARTRAGSPPGSVPPVDAHNQQAPIVDLGDHRSA